MKKTSLKHAGRLIRSKLPLADELAQSQLRLRVALECAEVGVWDWDIRQGRVVYTRPSAHPPLALEAYEVSDGHWRATTHPDDLARNQQLVQEAIDGRTNGFSIRYRVAWPPDKPTTWRWIDSRGRVTERDRRGRATRLLGIYEDVTERVTQEESARRRDLQVAQATRLAALGEMATAMAHEINQPLGALSAYIQTATLLLKKPASPRQDLLAIIERARMQVERTAEIVRRLRALYQGRGTVDQRVDMCAIVRSAVAMLQADMAAQGVRLDLTLGIKPVLAIGDELQIEQVLYNLLRNAVEALREVRGARRMTISVIRLPQLARVVVSDNGPGIPASLRARVFEPFVTTKHDGTGLGLSISRTIVEAHGGSLRLDVAKRKGTTFILDLPRSPRKCI